MKKALLFFLLVGLSQFVTAQITVTGTIEDDTGEGLPGATIQIKGTTNGTVTDIDGKYSIEVPNSENILVFSFVGFERKEETVGYRTVIDVTLKQGIIIDCPVYNPYYFPKHFSQTLYETKSSNPQTLTKTFQNSHQIYAPIQQANGGFVSKKGFQAQQSDYYVDGIRINNSTLNPQNAQLLTAFHPEQLSEISIGSRWQSSVGENVYLSLVDANSTRFGLDYALRYSSANDEQTAHASAKYGKEKWKFLTAITFSRFGNWRSGENSNASSDFKWKREVAVSQVNGADLLTPTAQPFLQSPNDYNSLFLTQKVVYDASKSKHELIFNYTRF